jgi:hypothetical protein
MKTPARSSGGFLTVRERMEMQCKSIRNCHRMIDPSAWLWNFDVNSKIWDKTYHQLAGVRITRRHSGRRDHHAA